MTESVFELKSSCVLDRKIETMKPGLFDIRKSEKFYSFIIFTLGVFFCSCCFLIVVVFLGEVLCFLIKC